MNLLSDSFYIVIIFSLLFAISIILIKGKIREKPRPRKLLTKSEYKMYFILKEALPEHKILVQVSFAAMLQANQRRTVNRFLAKRADYVICDNLLNVLLVLELNDWSHVGREKEDRARDKLLTDAGYKILHLKSIPSPEEMKKLFQEALK